MTALEQLTMIARHIAGVMAKFACPNDCVLCVTKTRDRSDRQHSMRRKIDDWYYALEVWYMDYPISSSIMVFWVVFWLGLTALAIMIGASLWIAGNLTIDECGWTKVVCPVSRWWYDPLEGHAPH